MGLDTAHLPECRYVVFQQQGQIPEAVIPMGCICSALRACEQRVREENGITGAIMQMLVAEGVEGVSAYGEARYQRGVQAARDAVLNAGLCAPHRCQSDALAAIDALRKPPSLPPTTGRAYKY